MVPQQSLKEMTSAFEMHAYTKAESRTDYLKRIAAGLSNVERQAQQFAASQAARLQGQGPGGTPSVTTTQAVMNQTGVPRQVQQPPQQPPQQPQPQPQQQGQQISEQRRQQMLDNAQLQEQQLHVQQQLMLRQAAVKQQQQLAGRQAVTRPKQAPSLADTKVS